MSTVARPKPTVFTAADDLLHEEYSGFGPHARESIIITAPIPEQELVVFTYLWREGGDRWGRFVFVAGPDMTKPEFLDFEADGVYSGEDLRDFEVSALHWRQPEPLKTAEVTYRSGELDLLLRFEAIHAPFSWHDNADGCPEWVAHDRYEQCGKTYVKMNLRGREIEFSGVGHRDHSWGTRNWNYLQHWKWINCAALDGTASVHCMLMNVQGQIHTNGYLNVGGVVSPIVTGEAKADLDEGMYHRHVSGHFVDELGRQMSIVCDYAAGWSMPIGHLYLNEVGMSATLNGAAAIAHIELGWPKDYVDALTGQS
ncbi:MAG: DUF7064 domain-containing protein [Sporichthyaceae bacterium]